MEDLKQLDLKNRIKSAVFYFHPYEPPKYRIDLEWYSGQKFGFNIYDTDYWCGRLNDFLRVDWKADIDFFSNEHVEEGQNAIERLIDKRMGVVTSRRGYDYVTFL